MAEPLKVEQQISGTNQGRLPAGTESSCRAMTLILLLLRRRLEAATEIHVPLALAGTFHAVQH
jgi:hypothetical protein